MLHCKKTCLINVTKCSELVVWCNEDVHQSVKVTKYLMEFRYIDQHKQMLWVGVKTCIDQYNHALISITKVLITKLLKNNYMGARPRLLMPIFKNVTVSFASVVNWKYTHIYIYIYTYICIHVYIYTIFQFLYILYISVNGFL